MGLLFRSGDDEWTSDGELLVNLDDGYNALICVLQAYNMVAKWTPEERGYHFFRGTSETEARVVSFLRRWDDGHISVVTLSVLPHEGRRALYVIVDDYKRPHESWVVYGARANDKIEEMGLRVGGRYLWIPFIGQ